MATPPAQAVPVLSWMNQSKLLLKGKNWIRLGKLDEIMMAK